MRTKTLLHGAALPVLLVGMLGFASPASAQNSGGAFVGVRSDYVMNGVVDYPNSPDTPEQDLSGAMMGVQGGYDFAFGRWSVGVVGDGDWGNLSTCVRDGNYITECGKLSAQYSARLRAGVELTDNLRAVLSGGYVWGVLDQQEQCPDPAAVPFGFCRPAAHHAPFNLSQTQTLQGTTYGISLEYALTRSLFLGFEWRRNQFGNEDFVLSPDASGNPLPTSTASFDNDQVGLSLNYRFGAN